MNCIDGKRVSHFCTKSSIAPISCDSKYKESTCGRGGAGGEDMLGVGGGKAKVSSVMPVEDEGMGSD